MPLNRVLHAGFAFFVLTLPLHAQTDAAALRTRLNEAAATTSLQVPAAGSWHLKLNVSAPLPSGAPQSGTVEEWWYSPDAYRITYTLPGYESTLVHTADGTFRTPGTGAPPYLPSRLLSQVTSPLPSQSEINNSTPELRDQVLSGRHFDCLMLAQPVRGFDGILPLGLFPTYCMDPGSSKLRLTSRLGNRLILRRKLGFFRGQSVAVDVAVLNAESTDATAQVVALGALTQDQSQVLDTSKLQAAGSASAIRVSNGLAKGYLVKKVSPEYPEDARRRHVEGEVVLHAIIDTDGHVEEVTPTQSPDPSLTIAALNAVRQWVYKPYLLNGQPAEIDTTVTVIFKQ